MISSVLSGYGMELSCRELRVLRYGAHDQSVHEEFGRPVQHFETSIISPSWPRAGQTPANRGVRAMNIVVAHEIAVGKISCISERLQFS